MSNKKILIGGTSGFVGKALVEYLTQKGHKIELLSRTHVPKKIFWDIENEYISPKDISGFDAIISLAGENIFTRWNHLKKEKILSSRIKSARAINKAITLAYKPPKVFICASAIGFYKTNQTILLDENSANGDNFLADVCKQWEEASHFLPTPQTRLVNARFATVLDSEGGFLSIAKNFAKYGIRLIFDNGSDMMSWVSLKDLCRAIEFMIENPSLNGAVNVCSPKQCTYAEFADALKSINKFSFAVKIPRRIMSIVLGELSETMIFSNICATPKKLIKNNFKFYDNDINTLSKRIFTKM